MAEKRSFFTMPRQVQWKMKQFKTIRFSLVRIDKSFIKYVFVPVETYVTLRLVEHFQAVKLLPETLWHCLFSFCCTLSSSLHAVPTENSVCNISTVIMIGEYLEIMVIVVEHATEWSKLLLVQFVHPLSWRVGSINLVSNASVILITQNVSNFWHFEFSSSTQLDIYKIGSVPLCASNNDVAIFVQSNYPLALNCCGAGNYHKWKSWCAWKYLNQLPKTTIFTDPHTKMLRLVSFIE